jgi:UMF1 family MFS transporter
MAQAAANRANGANEAGGAGWSRARLAAWCLYDWGNSAFPAIVLSFIFAPYFSQAVAPDETTGSALWGYAMTGAALAIAVVSPVVGAFSDKGGHKALWLAAFSLLAVAATASMWFVEPSAQYIVLALFLVALANFAFEVGYVFYNGMLPDLVPPRLIGRASGWGWGLGYIGGLACMAVALLLLVQPETPPFGLDPDNAEQYRATTVLCAAWFALFALPLFVLAPGAGGTGKPAARVVREGLSEVAATLRTLRRYPDAGWYLLAHMIYIDGLNTLFIFGGIYAAGTFGLELMEVLQFGLAMNLAAGIGSAAFGWLDDRLGPKRVLILSILALIGLGTALLIVEQVLWFWILGIALGSFFGPVQSASRSLMARLAPKDLTGQMFGLFSLSGKATAYVGPAAVGWVTAMADSQRVGMSVILVLLSAGLLVLLRVREPKAG